MNIRIPSTVRRLLLTAMPAMLLAPQCLAAGQIVQHFPAEEQESNMQTKWRIVWGIQKHAGGSEVLYIREAYFTRAPGEPETKVLGDTRLSEIFVPYNGGTRIYDISGYNFTLSDLNRFALGPACIVPGQIFKADGTPAETGPVVFEVHDDHLRWIKNGWPQDRCRRGQEIHLWSVLNAGNYRYIMLYVFRDDGQVGFRLGATASNLFDSKSDGATHLHTGCWRVSLDLGAPSETRVQKTRLDTRNLKTLLEPVTREQRISWNLQEFTRLNIRSNRLMNGHVNDNSFIGYDLIPMSSGSGHYFGTGEEFTRHEFWVTRDAVPAELRCRDLPRYEQGESLAGSRPILWHLAGALHRPRDEDFGKVGYKAGEGAALTAWAGFDLKPRDLFASTPLYPGGAPLCTGPEAAATGSAARAHSH